MSDDPVTRILSAIERLGVQILHRIDRLEAGSTHEHDRLPAEIIAHVQGIGDVEGKIGDWVGEPRSGRWIEGFAVTPLRPFSAEELLYRVVLGRDQLSPWTPSGRFCGSMGLAIPLRGFCMMLTGAAAANYECAYNASFVDGSVAAPTPGGTLCTSATLSPLEAFRVILRPRTA